MKANPVFSLYIPTKLVFGCGEIKKLSSEKLPGKKALVVISSGTDVYKRQMGGLLASMRAAFQESNRQNFQHNELL